MKKKHKKDAKNFVVASVGLPLVANVGGGASLQAMGKYMPAAGSALGGGMTLQMLKKLKGNNKKY